MMASVSEQLLDILESLDKAELKRFKWRLRERKGYFSTALKEADNTDTVDLMIKRFSQEKAVKITVEILKKIVRNDLAEMLENMAEGNKDLALVGASSKPIKAQAESSFVLVGASSKPTGVIVPKTRDNFLKYYNQLTLDLNTMNQDLCLSEENTVITNTDTPQSYPDHPDRFDKIPQVLCRESVSGRSYWEIEWSGEDDDKDDNKDDDVDDDVDDDDDDVDDEEEDDEVAECVSISVSYRSISRKGEGDECLLGSNDQSWSLICTPDSYTFCHNDSETDLTVEPISRRVGVYVDHSAGTLSFYNICRNTMILILTVQTTFTQPLYPGFTVCPGSSVKLCDESE